MEIASCQRLDSLGVGDHPWFRGLDWISIPSSIHPYTIVAVVMSLAILLIQIWFNWPHQSMFST
jgi:hypothetical protein